MLHFLTRRVWIFLIVSDGLRRQQVRIPWFIILVLMCMIMNDRIVCEQFYVWCVWQWLINGIELQSLTRSFLTHNIWLQSRITSLFTRITAENLCYKFTNNYIYLSKINTKKNPPIDYICILHHFQSALRRQADVGLKQTTSTNTRHHQALPSPSSISGSYHRHNSPDVVLSSSITQIYLL